jgi:hypothetical protein
MDRWRSLFSARDASRTERESLFLAQVDLLLRILPYVSSCEVEGGAGSLAIVSRLILFILSKR